MENSFEPKLHLSHKKDLAHLLMEKSYREGDFTLASGRKSTWYFDCRVTALDPYGSYLLGSIFAEEVPTISDNIRGVGGLELGACPLISATTALSRLNGGSLFGFIVRKQPKDHGTGKVIEGMENFQPGDKVVILEDVVTTGGSAIKAAQRAEEAGLEVAAIFAVLDREEGAYENILQAGYKFKTIFTRSTLKHFNQLWEEENG